MTNFKPLLFILFFFLPLQGHSNKIIIKQGNIITQKTDAIVNAANKHLVRGGGVCGAIFRYAGWVQLQDACNKIGSCPTGEARITDSFNLRNLGIKYIIHAVSPDCRFITNKQERVKLLTNTYQNSLKIADKHKLSTISFPFLGAGIYGCPKKLAAQTAIEAIDDYLNQNPNTSLKRIYMVLFSDEDLEILKSI